MLLSCPAKKVTKECGIGEALRLVAPAPEPPSPMYPTRRALGIRWSTLTGKTCYLVAVFLLGDCSTLARSADMFRDYPSSKKSEHFLLEQDVG